MRSNYIEKVLSRNLEAMTINELLNYLEFLQDHQFYFDRASGVYPFKRKYYDVIQFIVKKYGVLDLKDVE